MARARARVKSQPRDFYAKGILKLVHRWEKCISGHGDYVEK